MTDWPKIVEGYPTRFGLCFRNKEFFTEENDHNPMVIPNCSHCIMGRTAGTYGGPNRSNGHGLCVQCHGTGVAIPPIAKPMFENNSPAIPVSCNAHGFLRCPSCGFGFKYYDDRIWSGKRHSCGQRLIIDTSAHTKT